MIRNRMRIRYSTSRTDHRGAKFRSYFTLTGPAPYVVLALALALIGAIVWVTS